MVDSTTICNGLLDLNEADHRARFTTEAIQTLHSLHPTMSQHPSHDSREPAQDEEDLFRPPKDFQVEDRKDTRPPQGPHNQSNTPAKDSKFSFAFKSKAPQPAPAKTPSDLNTKAKQPPSRPADNRAPPTRPRNQDHPDSRYDKDFSRPPDRRPSHDQNPPPSDHRPKAVSQDRKHPLRSSTSARPTPPTSLTLASKEETSNLNLALARSFLPNSQPPNRYTTASQAMNPLLVPVPTAKSSKPSTSTLATKSPSRKSEWKASAMAPPLLLCGRSGCCSTFATNMWWLYRKSWLRRTRHTWSSSTSVTT